MTFQYLAFNDLSLEMLYEIMRLRQEVFVVEQDCPYLDADGRDHDSYHLMGFSPAGELVAYVRLLPKGLTYEDYPSIGRVVVSSKIRGTGAGKVLMEEALREAYLLFGDTTIKISAQCYLIHFYENLGFKITGKEYLEDNIPHIGMVISQ